MGMKEGLSHKEKLDTQYFVNCLRARWHDCTVTFPNVQTSKLILQFRTKPYPQLAVLGDFFATALAFSAPSDIESAEFTLWYRSILPSTWKLTLMSYGLDYDLVDVTSETNVEQIMRAFEVPFDPSKYL